MMVAMIVQDCNVCFSLIPRYLPTNQKPLSLTCEAMVAPAATDSTIRALYGSEKVVSAIIGLINPAAVIMAMVTDPWVILTIAANKYANIRGEIVLLMNNSAI